MQQLLTKCSNIVEKKLDEKLQDKFSDKRLVSAMRYSLLGGGKRLRPIITIITAEVFGVKAKDASDAAAAIEMIHAYSLIHDDLPSMDDDDFRRGKPSCHKKFDEATAILAGDALLTLAFEILSDKSCAKDAEVRCELVNLFAVNAGFKGMVAGQMIDINYKNKKISKAILEKLHLMKTAKLFCASALAGAIIGRASKSEKKSIENFALNFGLAFQTMDDISDFKNEASDANIVNLIGLKAAKKELGILKKNAIKNLEIFGDKACNLKALTQFVILEK